MSACEICGRENGDGPYERRRHEMCPRAWKGDYVGCYRVGNERVHKQVIELREAIQSERVAMLAQVTKLAAEERLARAVKGAARAQPCPGCVCADTDHVYCPICANAIQAVRVELDEARAQLVAVLDAVDKAGVGQTALDSMRNAMEVSRGS